MEQVETPFGVTPTVPPKVKFSMRSKLLLSVSGLLFLILVFLTLVTLKILTHEKRISVLQRQMGESQTYGKDLVQKENQILEQSKFILSNFDPRHEDSWLSKKVLLKNILQNQNNFQKIDIFKYDARSNSGVSVLQLQQEDEDSALPDTLTSELLKQLGPSQLKKLVEQSYLMVGVPIAGKSGRVALLTVDQQNPTPDHAWLMSIAYFFVPYSDLNDSSRLQITDSEGWVIFDSMENQPGDFQENSQILPKNISQTTPFQRIKALSVNSGVLDLEQSGVALLSSFYKPSADLVVLNQTLWKSAMRPVYDLGERLILIGLMAMGISIAVALLISKQVMQPIQTLSGAAQKVSEGHFYLDLEVKGKDEISVLTHSFNVMSKKIAELIDERLKKAHLENELAIASQVQQTLIPPAEVQLPHVQIKSYYRPADTCGGDWWGYFTKEHYTCFAIADATGHGLPSALITAAMRSCFSVIEKTFLHQNTSEAADREYTPSEMITIANQSIYDSSQGQIMMTLFLAILDTRTGDLQYSSAGHNPPWLFKKTSEGFARSSLVARGPRLGEARDIQAVQQKKVKIQHGDVIFMFTDGLIEGNSISGEMYSKSRLMKQLQELMPQGIDKVVTELEHEVSLHNQGKSLDDDVTITAVLFHEHLPPPQKEGAV